VAGVAVLNCPHCSTQNVAFNARGEWSTIRGEPRALFVCGACREGLIAEFWGAATVMQIGGDLSQAGIHLGRMWPEPPSGEAPDDTPPTAANFFQQGVSSFLAGNYDAAGMMFRKTLESATKILNPAQSTLSLMKRIDNLVEIGGLTPEMGSWAHEVRLGGNEAAHEDEPYTREEAQDLRYFIENFLRYAFTLPSAVRRRAQTNES
jgi:hypothetical protein